MRSELASHWSHRRRTRRSRRCSSSSRLQRSIAGRAVRSADVPSPTTNGRSMRRAGRSIRSASTARSAASNGSVLFVTLGIYYLLPFVRWDRGPNAPDQAVLIDLPNRRFYFFFIEIWPQEVYYFTGLLILAAMTLFLMNAVAGRVWCGYLCPQTVWTDLFHADRALGRGRPPRAHAARRRAVDRRARRAQRPQALPLADGRVVDRRRLGALFRRRADAGEGSRDRSGAAHRLCLDRHPHRSRPIRSPATCASRSASTCARGRASRRR